MDCQSIQQMRWNCGFHIVFIPIFRRKMTRYEKQTPGFFAQVLVTPGRIRYNETIKRRAGAGGPTE